MEFEEVANHLEELENILENRQQAGHHLEPIVLGNGEDRGEDDPDPDINYGDIVNERQDEVERGVEVAEVHEDDDPDIYPGVEPNNPENNYGDGDVALGGEDDNLDITNDNPNLDDDLPDEFNNGDIVPDAHEDGDVALEAAEGPLDVDHGLFHLLDNDDIAPEDHADGDVALEAGEDPLDVDRGLFHLLDSDDQDQDQDQDHDQEDEEIEDNEDPEDPQVDHLSMLRNLSEDWVLQEVNHRISKEASNSLWRLANDSFHQMYLAKANQGRKIPQLPHLRRKVYDDNLPPIKMAIAYQSKEDGEITVVEVESNPVSKFPPSRYRKLYEIASVKVSLSINSYVFTKTTLASPLECLCFGISFFC